jgi:hypothetical protein
MTVWYCSRCGQEALPIPGYLVFDYRYAIVRCDGQNEPGVSNADIAQGIRELRAQEAANRKRAKRDQFCQRKLAKAR